MPDVVKISSPAPLLLALKTSPTDSESLSTQAPVPWQQAMGRPKLCQIPARGSAGKCGAVKMERLS